MGRTSWVGACVLFCANGVMAGAVTVSVVNTSGASPANTIVVFYPLDSTPPPGHEAAVIDQVNKQFVPRVSVIRTGTAVSFPNSDNIRHQVYSFSPPKKFTLKLYAGSPSQPVVFDKPGIVVLGCNIHDKMSAVVAVVDSPYFAKTDAAGAAGLTLPSGRYRLKVWHQNLRTAIPPQDLAVTGDALSLPLSIDTDAGSVPVAPWPE